MLRERAGHQSAGPCASRRRRECHRFRSPPRGVSRRSKCHRKLPICVVACVSSGLARSSVRPHVVDVEVVESACRPEAAKFTNVDRFANSCRTKKALEVGPMTLAKWLFNAVGPQTVNHAAHVDMCFVDGVTKRFAGVAKHDEITGLRHESGQMSDRTLYDDVDTLHGNAAARRRISINDKKTAATCGSGRLRRVPFHAHLAGHHIFSKTGTRIAIDYNRRSLIHSGAVVAHMAFDIDHYWPF